jgi:hypothetical protein
MLKRILLAGWALLFLGGFLVVMFPNAGWNHYASEVLWAFSVALVVVTIGFWVVIAIRLLYRLVRPRPPAHASKAQQSATYPGRPRRRKMVVGLLSLLAVAVFLVSLLAFIEYRIKSSQVYQVSVSEARASSEVIGSLGQPVNVGWFTSGEITQASNGTGRAKLTIPLSGPKGRGMIKVEAGRLAGRWRFSTIQFISAGQGLTVDLLGGNRR